MIGFQTVTTVLLQKKAQQHRSTDSKCTHFGVNNVDQKHAIDIREHHKN